LVTCQSVAKWYYPGVTKVVSIKMNPALLLRIDGLSGNRSDFIRAAVEEKVKRAGAKGKSAWDTLAKTEGLDITIPKAASQVKRTDSTNNTKDFAPLGVKTFDPWKERL
jgi:hypothetical protein